MEEERCQEDHFFLQKNLVTRVIHLTTMQHEGLLSGIFVHVKPWTVWAMSGLAHSCAIFLFYLGGEI